MELTVSVSGEETKLILINTAQDGVDSGKDEYQLVDAESREPLIKLSYSKGLLDIIHKSPLITTPSEVLDEMLDEFALQLLESKQKGTESSESDEEEFSTPYNPDTIRVETKNFSLRQIFDMIETNDIDLTPDYQRNFVWDSYRKSRLIESILLRIPLPVFYFSQDEDGRINVVDGLQRLTTIVDFMRNKLRLRKLEYLRNCEGKFYKKDSPTDDNPVIDSKYFRWFNMTQITVNIIDPQSPSEVKYDIFRRINTGGKPLNGQEIRNCIASPALRSLLRQMSKLPSFTSATLGSVKDTRMEAQELALRFIAFHKLFSKDAKLSHYSGNMDSTLNQLVDELSRLKDVEIEKYIPLYDTALRNASHLFGEYAFRKTLINHVHPGAYRQLINKALFVSWTVLLSDFPTEIANQRLPFQSLARPLATEITNNPELFSMLTYSTNAKANLVYAFEVADRLINSYL